MDGDNGFEFCGWVLGEVEIFELGCVYYVEYVGVFLFVVCCLGWVVVVWYF